MCESQREEEPGHRAGGTDRAPRWGHTARWGGQTAMGGTAEGMEPTLSPAQPLGWRKLRGGDHRAGGELDPARGTCPPPARTAGRWSRPPQTKAEPVGVQTAARVVGVPTDPPSAAAGPQARVEGTQSCPGDTRSGGLCLEAGLGFPPSSAPFPAPPQTSQIGRAHV